LTTEESGLWHTENIRDAQPEWTLLDEYEFMHPLRVFFKPGNENEVWLTSFGNGMRVGIAGEIAAPANLTIHYDANELQLRWSPVAGAALYTVWSSSVHDAPPEEYMLIHTTADTSAMLPLPDESVGFYFVKAQ
jgi:hypothetical protein